MPINVQSNSTDFDGGDEESSFGRRTSTQTEIRAQRTERQAAAFVRILYGNHSLAAAADDQ